MDNFSPNVAYHVTRVMPDLQRYARALMRDRTDAEDLVQDCLERVVANWHRRQCVGEPRGWAFTILHNLAMTRLSQRYRRGQHLPIDQIGEDFLSVPADQDDVLYQADVEAALATLSTDHRRIIALVVGQGLSYGETAQELGVPVGTVMSRLARARANLQRTIAGKAGPTCLEPRRQRLA